MLDHKLRRKLLEKRNITLENAPTTARAWEAAGQQSRGMQASPASPAAANAISKQTTKRRLPTSHADAGPECHNCGRTGHFARDPNCPAKGKTCAHCQKLGHFASKCRSKGQSRPKPQPPPNVSRAAHQSHRHRRDKARCVDLDSPTDAPASADEGDYAFAIDHVHNSTASSSPGSAHAQVMLNGVATSALIDSGASCNLLGKAQLRELRQREHRVDLKPYDGSLFAYGARTPLDVVGQFLATVSAGSQTRRKFLSSSPEHRDDSSSVGRPPSTSDYSASTPREYPAASSASRRSWTLNQSFAITSSSNTLSCSPESGS